MREILFRGKTDKGEWVQGYFLLKVRDNNLHWILNGKEYIKVIPETVGQYTDLTDKNGTKIFEGDILLVDEGEEYEMRTQVEIQSGCWLMFENGQNRGFLALGAQHSKVIGNIHDNPELLDGAEQ